MNGDRSTGLASPPAGYTDWLGEIKAQIHDAQQRATQALNLELVRLYWKIGNSILVRQEQQGWGAKVVDQLANDLRVNFPGMRGFSLRNLKYMRAFAQGWPDSEMVQQLLHKLPSGHHLVLLAKLSGEEDRRWYAAKAIEHNWSRNILVMQIESRLLERCGAAVTNSGPACRASNRSNVSSPTTIPLPERTIQQTT